MVITNSTPCPKLRLLGGGAIAVISIWDESGPVSKLMFLRNPNDGAPICQTPSETKNLSVHSQWWREWLRAKR